MADPQQVASAFCNHYYSTFSQGVEALAGLYVSLIGSWSMLWLLFLWKALSIALRLSFLHPCLTFSCAFSMVVVVAVLSSSPPPPNLCWFCRDFSE